MSIQNVIAAAGGQSKLAEQLRCSRQSVSYWANGDRQPSVPFVWLMERLYPDVASRYTLRPDIYGPPPRKGRA